MKQLFIDNSSYVLRFDKNADVFAELLQYCKDNSISAASFSGIGAAGQVILAYYNLAEKTYEDHTIQEDMEIVSLLGNVSLLNGTPAIHAHGSFSKKDLTLIGGHVKKLIVSATCEIVLQKLNGTLRRAKDAETGLNLLQ